MNRKDRDRGAEMRLTERTRKLKTPLGMEVDLGARHIVLYGFPALRGRGTAPPSFRPLSIVATVAHLSYC